MDLSLEYKHITVLRGENMNICKKTKILIKWKQLHKCSLRDHWQLIMQNVVSGADYGATNLRVPLSMYVSQLG